MSHLSRLVEIIAGRPLLTSKDLARRYGKSFNTISAWHKAGKLPRPVYLPGCRFPFWRPSDIARFETNSPKLSIHE